MDEEIVEQEINITTAILETINSLCQSLIDSINNSIFGMVDELIFVDESLVKDNYIDKIFGSSNGILILANALVIAFILYYGVKRFTSYYSGQEIEPIHKFILRAILVVMVMNFSLDICSGFLGFNYNLSQAICDIGRKNLGNEISFSALLNNFSTISKSKFNLFSINGLLTSTLTFSSFSLVIIFVLRSITIKLLIFLAPFSFLTLLTRQTSGIFKGWLKSFISLLLIQFVVALILLIPFAIIKEKGSDILSQLMIIGSISALLKSNQFVKEYINGTGITSDFSSGMGGIKSLFIK